MKGFLQFIGENYIWIILALLFVVLMITIFIAYNPQFGVDINPFEIT